MPWQACTTPTGRCSPVVETSGRAHTPCFGAQYLNMKFSPVTLVLVGGLGFVLGTVMHQQRPQVALAQTPAPAPPANDGKLRIIVFGAHPDDAEYRGAGVAMKWAKQGHHVKLVSATNGDVGHCERAGGPLALYPKKEVERVAKRWNVTPGLANIRACEIMPTLE